MISVTIFWTAVAILLYATFGFPVVTWLRTRWLYRPLQSESLSSYPHITLIIAAYNEADVILQKLHNAAALDYPAERLEIIVASDGSDDGTQEIVRSFQEKPVRLLDLPRQGKNTTINQAVAAAGGDILVFTDADSMLRPDALCELVAPLTDQTIGGVAGNYHYRSEEAEGLGEKSYWDFDRRIKEWQSATGSVTSATGQIYAIRRSLFQPVPAAVTDDAFISRSVIGQQQRLVFNPAAVASGPIADADGEYRRKIRVTTRGLNTVWQQRFLLNPFRFGYYSLQLFSHKVLRRLIGLPLLIIAIATPFIWSKGVIYRLAAVGQLAFHGAALTGYLLRHRPLGRKKPLSLPFHFDMVNLAALQAAVKLLRGHRFDVWQAERMRPSIHKGEEAR